MRYHARSMDAANDRTSDTPIDVFHLQIWPEAESAAAQLKITSEQARYWSTV